MNEDNAGVFFDRGLCGPQDRGRESTQQLYRDEIQRMIDHLYTYLPIYQKQLGTRTYTLVRGNLRVLASCFYSNSLNTEAVEVLHEHLLALSRMLACKSN